MAAHSSDLSKPPGCTTKDWRQKSFFRGSSLAQRRRIPVAACEQIGENITSTRDEVRALRAWADRNHARVIIVPTDPFHTRRLKALTRSLFAGSPTRVLVTVVEPPGYRWQEWWRDEHGFLAFQNELLKSVQNAFK